MKVRLEPDHAVRIEQGGNGMPELICIAYVITCLVAIFYDQLTQRWYR